MDLVNHTREGKNAIRGVKEKNISKLMYKMKKQDTKSRKKGKILAEELELKTEMNEIDAKKSYARIRYEVRYNSLIAEIFVAILFKHPITKPASD